MFGHPFIKTLFRQSIIKNQKPEKLYLKSHIMHELKLFSNNKPKNKDFNSTKVSWSSQSQNYRQPDFWRKS